MKKKMVALLTAVSVLAMSVMGCGTTQGTVTVDETATAADSQVADTEAAESEDTAAIPDGVGGYKIGFWYTPDSDLLSASFRRTLEWCAEQTNCEIEYYDIMDWSSESQTAAVETLVSNGCDGIIMMYGNSPAMFQYMNDAGVYYAGMTRSHSEEIAQVADSSEYCCGWLDENSGAGNVTWGYEITKALADQGCQKIAYVGGSVGVEVQDDRIKGVEQAAEELGLEVVASYRGSEYATGFSDILATYGNEIDGIAFTQGTDVGVAAIQTAGLTGKVKIAQVDNAGVDTRDYLDAGLLTGCYAGNNTFVMQMYMQVFNALSGADRLFDEGEKLIPQIGAFLVVGVDEWDKVDTYTNSEIFGLTSEELLSLNSIYAPDTTVEEKEDLMTYYASDEFWNVDSLCERMEAYLGE